MNKVNELHLLPKDFFLKITILKSMMYCGVLWGLYRQGWAMTSDQEHHIFPFWLSCAQAEKHAQKHWPNYTPRKITPEDFQKSLLPTLVRLNVTPTLYNSNQQKFKFSSQMMKYFFFNKPDNLLA
ncbi:hypothetical protein A6M14_05495 [Acinetobacter sp. Ac_877]|uniref:DUF2750 domain-containing protein n=1 Tax=Acinetobacter portensis TaxID=1839785 RepID=UPI00128E54BF|nr:DUF2750 domain-containing protein [Acinetobacter portensis]MPW40761.1 hypothetical protein [Acinetobacter portensis]